MTRKQFHFWLLVGELWLAFSALVGGAYGQCGPQGCPAQPGMFGGGFQIEEPQYQPQWQPRQQPQQPEGPDHGAPENVVRIGNRLGNQTIKGSGTLVDGGVLTCAHLFNEGVGSIAVKLPATGQIVPAQLAGKDPSLDLAFLTIADNNYRAVPISAVKPRLGERVSSGGYGGDRVYRPFSGVVLSYSRDDDLQFSGAARQGDSGGPIFNQSGELVGVVCYTDGSTSGGACCARIRAFLARLGRRPGANAKPAPKNSDGDFAAPKADDMPPMVAIPKQPPQQNTPDAGRPLDNSALLKRLADRVAELEAEKARVANQSAVPPVISIPGAPTLPTAESQQSPGWLDSAKTGARGVLDMGVGKAISLALIYVGVPGSAAAVVSWLVVRRGKKRVDKLIAKRHGSASPTEGDSSSLLQSLKSKIDEVAERFHQTKSEQATAVQPAAVVAATPVPQVVTSYSLSDAYASSLAEKRAHEGASIPQEALMGQLYKAVIGRMRAAGKSLAETSFAKQVEEEVREDFLNRHGVKTSY